MSNLFSDDLDGVDGKPTSRSDRRRQQHRTHQRRKNIISFVVMVAALGLLIGGAIIFIKPLLSGAPTAEPTDYPGPGSGSVEIVIEPGDTGAVIGRTLTDADIVLTVESFTSAYTANPKATGIQAGTYALPKEMRATDAVAALLDPAYRADVRITIPEGWTAAQILEKIGNSLNVPLEDVEAAGETVAADLLPETADGNLEGWLAPATYTLEPKASDEDVLREMVALTTTTFKGLNIDPADQQDVLIKSSIVEKEVPSKYRGQVARVIENRLEGCSGDFRLGMDTTLVYAFGKNYSEISADEMRDSPYNGRVHAGLPPTPIGSPSVESIEAVMDPPSGSWCYFTTVNLETQETRFVDTLAEHQKNQEEYRAYLKELRSESEEASPNE